MKRITLLLLLILSVSVLNAQSVEGKLVFNGKSNSEIKLKGKSVNELLEIINSKNKLQFLFKGNGIEKGQKTTFILSSILKSNGKILKKVTSEKVISFFPGEYAVPIEKFDVKNLFVVVSWDDMVKKGGNYTLELQANPKDIKGSIKPVSLNFVLRKRPGR